MKRTHYFTIIAAAASAVMMVSCIRKTQAPADPVKETIVVKTRETIVATPEQMEVAPPTPQPVETTQPAQPVQQASQPRSQAMSSMSFEMLGRLGGDSNSRLILRGNRGSVTFTNYTRDIRLQSFNEVTGDLVLKAYEKGTNKYVGTFNGVYDSGSYSGVFTNYKGASIDFNY